MNPTIGVIVFPGSNCEQDALEAVASLGANSKLLWHDSSDLGDVDGVIIPGGFAHETIYDWSNRTILPAMESVISFAFDDCIRICNGSNLNEAGLLPDAQK